MRLGLRKCTLRAALVVSLMPALVLRQVKNKSVSSDLRVSHCGCERCCGAVTRVIVEANNDHELIKPMLDLLPDCINELQRAQIDRDVVTA